MTEPKKALVSGGTGFVGRAVAARLASEGYDVCVLTRRDDGEKRLPGIRYAKGDMLVPESVPLADCDIFVNCAGELSDKGRMRALHVEAVRALLDALPPGRDVHWMQMSSVGVYGPKRDGIVDESEPFAPVGEYEVTKAEGENLVRTMCADKGLSCTILRPSNVFGTGMPNQSLAQLLRSIQKGLFVYLGDPAGYRMNYVHVEDVAASAAAALHGNRQREAIFNVSDSMTQPAFVELVKREFGVTSPTRRLPLRLVRALAALGERLPGFPLTRARVDALTIRACYSTERLRTATAFVPAVGIEAGLREFAASLRAQGPA